MSRGVRDDIEKLRAREVARVKVSDHGLYPSPNNFEPYSEAEAIDEVNK